MCCLASCLPVCFLLLLQDPAVALTGTYNENSRNTALTFRFYVHDILKHAELTTTDDSFFPVSVSPHPSSHSLLSSSVCLISRCLPPFARHHWALLQDWARNNSCHHLCRRGADAHHCDHHLPMCQLSTSEDREWWGSEAEMCHMIIFVMLFRMHHRWEGEFCSYYAFKLLLLLVITVGCLL